MKKILKINLYIDFPKNQQDATCDIQPTTKKHDKYLDIDWDNSQFEAFSEFEVF